MGVERGAPGDHTNAEVVGTIRQHGAAPQVDITDLFRCIAFSILITNVDDHLRNRSFLHTDAAQWCLSPAFDADPFPERARELKTWITEDAGPAMKVVAPQFSVRVSPARSSRDCACSSRRTHEISILRAWARVTERVTTRTNRDRRPKLASVT